MPVSRSDPRRAVVIGLAAVVAAGAIVFVAVALGNEPRSSTPFGPDDPEFTVGNAERLAAAIARDNHPLGFEDAASSENPIWVNHVGADPKDGWVAFDAVVGDDCIVDWEPAAGHFVDCDGTVYPPDGDGLPQYEARVEDDEVIVDFSPDDD